MNVDGEGKFNREAQDRIGNRANTHSSHCAKPRGTDSYNMHIPVKV